MDIDCLIRTERGSNKGIKRAIRGNLFVPAQVVNRIIGCADKCHIGLFNQSTGSHIRIFLKHLITMIPNSLCAFYCQRLIDAKELLQLHMAPMVHGIADSHFQRFHELHEAFKSGFISGDVILVHTVGTHHTPLIVVAVVAAIRLLTAQPYLYQIVKAAIFVDFTGIQMAMVVHHRQVFCIIVE